MDRAVFGNHSLGFFTHSLINRLAEYSLPLELTAFYKSHIQLITEKKSTLIEGEMQPKAKLKSSPLTWHVWIFCTAYFYFKLRSCEKIEKGYSR